MDKKELKDKGNEFYDSINNTFNLEIKIDVKNTIENIIKFEINSISEWQVSKQARIYSDPVKFGNFQWYLCLENMQDPDSQDFYLSMFLYCSSDLKK